jgi:drug/metabolite transporter (DMT)-like permease
MGIILGLLAALLYGSSDFAGGLASRRIPSVTVNLIGSLAAGVTIWGALLASGGPAPELVPVLWGVAGGVGGGLGSLALYKGLARGQMSVVGPVSAVSATVVPVLAGLLFGERPGLLAMAGIVVALPAIALVATTGGGWGGGKLGVSLVDGLTAGAAFGVLFIAMAKAGPHAGLWPVAAENVSALLLILVLKLASKPEPTPGTRPVRLSSPRQLAMPVFSGASGAAATLMFFFSAHMSMLATAAVIVSLYPSVTVLLARAVLHERFSGVQRVGVGLCAFAVVAIAVH